MINVEGRQKKGLKIDLIQLIIKSKISETEPLSLDLLTVDDINDLNLLIATILDLPIINTSSKLSLPLKDLRKEVDEAIDNELKLHYGSNWWAPANPRAKGVDKKRFFMWENDFYEND